MTFLNPLSSACKMALLSERFYLALSHVKPKMTITKRDYRERKQQPQALVSEFGTLSIWGQSPLAPSNQSSMAPPVSGELPQVKPGWSGTNQTPRHSSNTVTCHLGLVGVQLTAHRARNITLKNRMARGTKQKAKTVRENRGHIIPQFFPSASKTLCD